MPVFLEAIKFNHDPESACCDAINIRRNETEIVVVPEWQKGISKTPEDSPAVYSIKDTEGQQITVLAKFSSKKLAGKTVEIVAIDPNDRDPTNSMNDFHRNVLGSLGPENVTFDETGDSDFQSFDITNSLIQEIGVSRSVTEWHWQFRISPEHSWETFEITKHQIYTTIKQPFKPWSLDWTAENSSLVWTEVLDLVCDWARGTKELDDAATQVTRGVRSLETDFKLVYDFSNYYSYPDFNCSGFLDFLKGGIGKGPRVNCSDCATIVSTFANGLGCELWQSSMSSSKPSFTTNPIRVFGRTCFLPETFTGHEVAWTNECTVANPLFDAALELDGDDDPTSKPRAPILPVNMIFGTTGIKIGQPEYLSHLVSPTVRNEAPKPNPQCRIRRDIRPSPNKRVKPACGNIRKLLKTHYDYPSWSEPSSDKESLFLTSLVIDKESFSDWRFLDDGKEILKNNRGPIAQHIVEFFGIKTKHKCRLDIELCASARAARSVLLHYLTNFETPDLQRVEAVEIGDGQVQIGDVAFIEPQKGSIVFAASNLVILVRNIGSELTPLPLVARRLDQYFKQTLIVTGSKDWFQIPEGQFKAGDQVPLVPQFTSPERPSFKLFSSTGGITCSRNELFFSSALSGNNQLHVFGTTAEGAVLKQVLVIPLVNSAVPSEQ